MTIQGFLGIDVGTQGLSVVFTDEYLNLLAAGNGNYEMVAGLEDGCYEQQPADWETALVQAMRELRGRMSGTNQDFRVLAIGVSGQMHGEVLIDGSGRVIKPARLWCDSRNEAEAIELTQRLGVKMPKRMTAVRWLWTTRNDPDLAAGVSRMTTPAGWISHRLTGSWTLGIGDASGMFPVNQDTLDYDARRLKLFQQLVAVESAIPLANLLPELRRAGQDGGTLNARGAELLGLTPGVPVAPAEGDQPAALAGSSIADAGMVSVSFGTSVCANSVGDRPFVGVSDAVDHFCAADGKPINMVLLRNGTTFMNAVVEMFAGKGDRGGAGFSNLMQQALLAPPDCGGVLAVPFMDDEPGLGIGCGNSAALHGIHADNATPGNMVKAALLASIFNLKTGMDILAAQGFPRSGIMLTGGLTKTPQLGQILADVMQVTVRLPACAEEGTAIGSAMLAKYRHCVLRGGRQSWSTFVSHQAKPDRQKFQPNPVDARQYVDVYARYCQLLKNLC